MHKIKIMNLTETSERKLKMLQLMPKLPANFKEKFFEEYKKYDNRVGINRFNNTIYAKNVDPEILKILERMVK